MGSVQLTESNKQQTQQENEFLSCFSSRPPQRRTRFQWPLLFQLRPQQTVQERVQHPGHRLQVLHPRGCSTGRRADRAGHQRPRTSHYLRSTNDAFAKIPSDTLTGLLGDVPALTEILLRHVVPGKTVKLYSGAQSFDNAGGSQLTVNGYKVTSSAATAGVLGKSVASDGRVYAIDTVI